MSKATKRKHVTREVVHDFILPEEHQQIVQVVAPRGNNLHEVKTSCGVKFLASMPTKFRKNVWIKRGDYVIVDPIEEGDKVKGEIVVILFPKQIKFIQKEALWPKEFLPHCSGNQSPNNGTLAEVTERFEKTSLKMGEEEDSSEGDDNDDDLFINTNRPPVVYYTSDESSDESSSEEENKDGVEASRVEDQDDESSVDH